MRGRSIAVLLGALVGCGSVQEAPPRPSTAAREMVAPARVDAAAAAPADAEPEAAGPVALEVGAFVVIDGIGFVQVEGPREYEGKPGLAFRRVPDGTRYVFELEGTKAPGFARAPVSKAEAERRLALLEDPTPVTDTRPKKARSVELFRGMARGSALDHIALLRARYASTFAPDAHRMEIHHLEGAVLPELAHVLGVEQDALVARLHAAHAGGTYAKTATPRPPEPEPVPPEDPWRIKGHEYVGAFVLEGGELVVGDPVYVTTKHDEPPQDVTKNVHVAATPGTWRCYLELDPKDPSDVMMSFIMIHDSAKARFGRARREAAAVARLWVDSGQMAGIDGAVRDDPAYEDARLFGGDDLGILGGRGCLVHAGGGDGTYTTRVLALDGKAVYIHVDFTGESRDFVRDARSKLSYCAADRLVEGADVDQRGRGAVGGDELGVSADAKYEMSGGYIESTRRFPPMAADPSRPRGARRQHRGDPRVHLAREAPPHRLRALGLRPQDRLLQRTEAFAGITILNR